MCEFRVIFGDKIVFQDVTYVKADENKVILKNVLGASKVLEHCRILEVDVASERLVLSPIEAH